MNQPSKNGRWRGIAAAPPAGPAKPPRAAPFAAQKYEVSGSVCQKGIFCPCLGDVTFDLTSTGGDPSTGEIRKVTGPA